MCQAYCGDDVCGVFLQNKSPLPQTNLILSPPRISNDTVPGSWLSVQHYTEWTIKGESNCAARNLQLVIIKSAHEIQQTVVFCQCTVEVGTYSEVEQQCGLKWSKITFKKKMLFGFNVPETSSHKTNKPSIFSKCFVIKEVNFWHAKGKSELSKLTPLLPLLRETPDNCLPREDQLFPHFAVNTDENKQTANFKSVTQKAANKLNVWRFPLLRHSTHWIMRTCHTTISINYLAPIWKLGKNSMHRSGDLLRCTDKAYTGDLIAVAEEKGVDTVRCRQSTHTQAVCNENLTIIWVGSSCRLSEMNAVGEALPPQLCHTVITG